MTKHGEITKVITIIIGVILLLTPLLISTACSPPSYEGEVINRMEVFELLLILSIIAPHASQDSLITILLINMPDIKYEEQSVASGGGMRGVGGGHSDGH